MISPVASGLPPLPDHPRVVSSFLDLVGDTPLIEIRRLDRGEPGERPEGVPARARRFGAAQRRAQRRDRARIRAAHEFLLREVAHRAGWVAERGHQLGRAARR